MRRVLLLLFVFELFSTPSWAETLKLSTYYPVPNGTYDQLRLLPRENLSEPCQAGTIYVNEAGHLQYCNSKEKETHWTSVGTYVERGSLTLSNQQSYTVNFHVPFSNLPLIQIYALVDVPNEKGNKKTLMSYSTGVGIYDVSPTSFKINHFESPKAVTIYWVAVGN